MEDWGKKFDKDSDEGGLGSPEDYMQQEYAKAE